MSVMSRRDGHRRPVAFCAEEDDGSSLDPRRHVALHAVASMRMRAPKVAPESEPQGVFVFGVHDEYYSTREKRLRTQYSTQYCDLGVWSAYLNKHIIVNDCKYYLHFYFECVQICMLLFLVPPKILQLLVYYCTGYTVETRERG